MNNLKDDALLFQSLADPTRLKILQLLADPQECECNGKKSLSRELCVNAIAKHTGVTQSAVSQHLRLLKQAGLVKGARKGSFVHYSMDLDGLIEFRARMNKILKIEK